MTNIQLRQIEDLIAFYAAQLGISEQEFVERSIKWIAEHWDSQLRRELGNVEDGIQKMDRDVRSLSQTFQDLSDLIGDKLDESEMEDDR